MSITQLEAIEGAERLARVMAEAEARFVGDTRAKTNAAVELLVEHGVDFQSDDSPLTQFAAQVAGKECEPDVGGVGNPLRLTHVNLYYALYEEPWAEDISISLAVAGPLAAVEQLWNEGGAERLAILLDADVRDAAGISDPDWAEV